ncbi:hypothetical protein SprV_0301212300 [Sparganum proliferum]
MEQLALAYNLLRVDFSQVQIPAVLANQAKDILQCLPSKTTSPGAALLLVEAELKSLKELGFLVPVSYSTWAAPIVTSPQVLMLRVDAYLQIKVALDSRELLTTNTHCGLFQYTRLPSSVKTLPALFQQMMNAMLSGTLAQMVTSLRNEQQSVVVIYIDLSKAFDKLPHGDGVCGP